MAIAFLQGTRDTSDLQNYTFSSQNLGAAASDRDIIGVITGRSVGSLLTCSIGGVSAAIRDQVTNSSNTVAIVTARVPTGTTGDVLAGWSEDGLRCVIALYRATGLDTSVPFHIQTSIADSPTGTIVVPAGGFVIGGVFSGFSSGTISWSGITEDFEIQAEGTSSGTMSSAHDSFVSAQSGLTVTATSSQAGSAGIFASWGPFKNSHYYRQMMQALAG